MDPGCDMSEAELLAMLRGIDAGKIQRQTEAELVEKYGPLDNAPGQAKPPAADSTASSGTDKALTTASICVPTPVAGTEAFLLSAPEDHTGAKSDLNQYWYSAKSINQLVAEVQTEAPRPLKVAFISTPSLFFSLTAEERQECVVLDYDSQWADVPGYYFYDFNDPENVPPALHNAFDMVVIDPPFVQEACWRAYSKTANLLLREDPLSATALLRQERDQEQKKEAAGNNNTSSQSNNDTDTTLPVEPALALCDVVAPPLEPSNNNSASNAVEVLATSVVEEGVDTLSIADESGGFASSGAKISKGRNGLVLLTTILENAPLLEELFGVKPNKFRPSIPNLVYQYHIFTNYNSTGLSEVNPEVGE